MRAHSSVLYVDKCPYRRAIQHPNFPNRQVRRQPTGPIFDCSWPADEVHVRESLTADRRIVAAALECPTECHCSFCLFSFFCWCSGDSAMWRIVAATSPASDDVSAVRDAFALESCASGAVLSRRVCCRLRSRHDDWMYGNAGTPFGRDARLTAADRNRAAVQRAASEPFDGAWVYRGPKCCRAPASVGSMCPTNFDYLNSLIFSPCVSWSRLWEAVAPESAHWFGAHVLFDPRSMNGHSYRYRHRNRTDFLCACRPGGLGSRTRLCDFHRHCKWNQHRRLHQCPHCSRTLCSI